MFIEKSKVLGDIADLQKSPWFKSGADSENFCLRNQYIGRKEAVEIVRDLCIVKNEEVKAIPIDKVKQAKEQMLDSKFYGKTVATYNDAIKDCVEILDKLMEESEG